MSSLNYQKYETGREVVKFLDRFSTNDTNYYNILLNLFNIDSRFNDFLLSPEIMYDSIKDREYLKLWWYETFIQNN